MIPIKQYTISVLVKNKFGALANIAALFGDRGYNIESLSVNHTLDPNVSHMTIVSSGTSDVIKQIQKLLSKVDNVISVEDVTSANHIERGLVLLKISASKENRFEIIQLTETFGGKVLNVKKDSVFIELTGTPEHIDNYLALMKEFGLLAVSRAGRTAICKD